MVIVLLDSSQNELLATCKYKIHFSQVYTQMIEEMEQSGVTNLMDADDRKRVAKYSSL